MKWTPAQEAAISARGFDLAVIAAAGSGKTAVLTQRIISLLSEKDGIDAAKLAVVTFTRAAAQELETRLYAALAQKAGEGEEGAHLTRQLFRLSRAQISTIHSFAFSLIREYKKELGFGENVRIADPTEASLLRKKETDAAVKKFFDVSDESAQARREVLYRLFGTGRNSAGLAEAVLRLQEKASSYPGGVEDFLLLQQSLEHEVAKLASGRVSFFETRQGKILMEELRKKTQEAALTLSSLAAMLRNTQTVGEIYGEHFERCTEELEGCLALLEKNHPVQAHLQLEALFSSSLPTVRKCPPEEQDLKTLAQGIYNDRVKKPLLALYRDLLEQKETEISRDTEEMLSLTGELLTLTQNALARYQKAKKEKGIVDYADLEHMTLSLLYEKRDGKWETSALAEKIADGFDAVFVDEYQDTNRIQDMIFSAVAKKGRLFLVGDPKQSIYRFRGADPDIFTSYKNKLPLYPHEGGGMQKILLSDNFRCDEAVIDLVNRIFSVMMDDEKPGSLYQRGDRLRFGKIKDDAANVFPAELVFVDKTREEDKEEDAVAEEENREAAYIASRIGKMLAQEEKAPGVPFLPEDIAVICRTHLQISRVKSALEARGIPSSAGGEGEIRESAEYLFVTSLLSALDNPTRDIPLLGALSSPVFCFTPDALYRIRKENRGVGFYSALRRYAENGGHPQTKEMCREALETFSRLRDEAKSVPLTAFLFSLYRRFSLEALFSSKGGEGRKVKEMLLSAAGACTGAGITSLGDFCRYLEEMELPATGGGEGVNLMTVHKSKGLEFPVVFVSFLAQPFSKKDEGAAMLLSPELGVFLPIPKLCGRAKLNPLVRKAARFFIHRESLEEEKRVLYVALTRARTRLILTSSPRSIKSLQKELLLSGEGALSRELISCLTDAASSPLSLILLSLREDEAVQKVLLEGGCAQNGSFSVKMELPTPFEMPEIAPAEKKEVKFSPEKVLAGLDFVYENKHLETLPKKLSISQILRENREEEEVDFYPRRLLDFERGVLKSGAETIGTATHQVMQFASFEAMEKDPEGEFRRLTEMEFLSPEDMALVEKDKVIAFFSSPLYRRMKESSSVEHEKRFNVLLPAERLGVGEGEVLVQGVVDAWFENPDGTLTLLDFKTDRVKGQEGEEILLRRHGQQLRLYAMAVESMTGKTVSDLFLYSFALGKEIPVSKDPV